MKASRLLAIFFMVSCFNTVSVNASEHHSGHNMGSGGGGGGHDGVCMKPQLTKFLPANLATVAPGSGFSFQAFNVEKPEQIKVNVKTIPVEVTTEDKDSFFIVKGKLPAELVNTTARISIKVVNAKNPKCNGENGWLVKIAEQ
jgi:hypothetical protein